MQATKAFVTTFAELGTSSDPINNVIEGIEITLQKQEGSSTHGWKDDFSVEWIFEQNSEDVSKFEVEFDGLVKAEDFRRGIDMSEGKDEDE